MTETELKKRVAALPRRGQIAYAAIVIERTLGAAVTVIYSDHQSLVREVLNALWSYLAGDQCAPDGVALELLHGRLDEQMDEALGENWEEGEEPNEPVLFAVSCACTLPVAALRWPDKAQPMGGVLDHYFRVWNSCADLDPETYGCEDRTAEVTWAEHIVRWLAE